MASQDPSHGETPDATAIESGGGEGLDMDPQRDAHLRRLRTTHAAAEIDRLREALEELEMESLELLRDGQRSHERIADLELALELQRGAAAAAEARARVADEVIASMQAGISWRVTRPLRVLAAGTRSLLRRRAAETP